MIFATSTPSSTCPRTEGKRDLSGHSSERRDQGSWTSAGPHPCGYYAPLNLNRCRRPEQPTMKLRIRWQTFLLRELDRFSVGAATSFLVIGYTHAGLRWLRAARREALSGLCDLAISADIEVAGPSVGSGESFHLPPLSPGSGGGEPARDLKVVHCSRSRCPIGTHRDRYIGLEVMILEGIDDGVLRRGVGHIPGTSLPGQPGNVAIAGHRDTFSDRCAKFRKNDEITLTTLHGSFRYSGGLYPRESSRRTRKCWTIRMRPF